MHQQRRCEQCEDGDTDAEPGDAIPVGVIIADAVEVARFPRSVDHVPVFGEVGEGNSTVLLSTSSPLWSKIVPGKFTT